MNERLEKLRQHLAGALAAVGALEARYLDEDKLRRALLHRGSVANGDLGALLSKGPGLRPEDEDEPYPRPPSPKEAGQIGALLDLYFALTSEAGTWSFAEMAGWQREAGLKPLKPIKFITAPGNGQQSAVKAR